MVIENLGNLKTAQTYKTFKGLKNYDISIGLPILYAILWKAESFLKNK